MLEPGIIIHYQFDEDHGHLILFQTLFRVPTCPHRLLIQTRRVRRVRARDGTWREFPGRVMATRLRARFFFFYVNVALPRCCWPTQKVRSVLSNFVCGCARVKGTVIMRIYRSAASEPRAGCAPVNSFLIVVAFVPERHEAHHKDHAAIAINSGRDDRNIARHIATDFACIFQSRSVSLAFCTFNGQIVSIFAYARDR